MTELEKVKALLQIADSSQDTLLTVLLEQAADEALTITQQTDSSELAPVIRLMVVEKFNRLGTESVTSISYSGIAETYTTDYSAQVVKLLNSKKRLIAL